MRCLFASDLHGHVDRYEKLFHEIIGRHPDAVFLGGDLLPNPWVMQKSIDPEHRDFVHGFLAAELSRIRSILGARYPKVFVILGNDDARIEEAAILSVATEGLWSYAHDRRLHLGDRPVFGYACVPPSPFRLKDWERYDVSRYVDPGCVSPEEGLRTVPVPGHHIRYSTIEKDLSALVGNAEVDRAIVVFHAPPYQTCLDRAALDDQSIDHVPLDVHVGSIAIRRFLETRQPAISLHGHVHESARITGDWRDRIGRTWLFGAAHDGPELALVEFDPDTPERATRELL